ncbi:MAG: IclR family transcriptional regulator [Hydrogenophaga sp.]|jgi:DNA-binding IclR family transcriptional regulator|uniref:IclR family transcriptional regulator n=1 Tax=Hydrogenophaga sp. TaxID=1904254 RepID=UPI001E00A70A|nr:helix-turn-helix domain-containing protein [Hydrogenophaga sp.]MBW0170307.1 helix-turn-helix domain-containing protein [Hydrogenophaga sp.]MBW0185558.1 helix-turn-helix domain-containing protein [Hydrogenophaga sp.]
MQLEDTEEPDARLGRSPTNRSLVRGIEILRAFRPGSHWLGNGDLAERTGLSPATVSRLTQTLVLTGLLQHDPRRRAYALAAPVLSIAHAMRTGSTVLATAAPLMRALAESQRINVGLAAPDKDEMVYLESIRYNRRVALRKVLSGQRVPMELTSLGRAYLATITASKRKRLQATFQQRAGPHWRELSVEINTAIQQVQTQGYCAASWQPEVVALATPLVTDEGTFALNVSVSTDEPLPRTARLLSAPLLKLAGEIQASLARLPA